MKKTTAILLALALVLGLAACGGPKPEDAVKELCEAMKSFDLDAIQSMVAGTIDQEGLFGEDTDLSEDETGLVDFIKTNAADMSYNIVSSSVSGDTATVTTKLDYKDVSPVIKEIYTEYFTQMMGMLFGGEEPDEAAFASIIDDKIAGVDRLDGTENVVFDLTKTDGAWKINEFPEGALKVLTGNMEAGMDDLGDLFNEGDWDLGNSYEPKDFPVSDLVIFENEEAAMIMTGGHMDEWGDCSFDILCRNKTADKELYFEVESVVINGWVTGGLFGDTLDAGKEETSQLTIWRSSMELPGIEDPDRMDLGIRIINTDWLSDDEPIVQDVITVYPTGLSEAQIQEPARPSMPGEKVAVDNDDILFMVIGEDDNGWGDMAGALLVYAENRTDKALSLSWEDVKVNGVDTSTYFGETLPAGTKGIFGLSFDSESFKDGYITDYESVEFTLVASDAYDWAADPVFRDSFVYLP